MIVVLEGGCGTGKSTVGRALIERFPGHVLYRPFRTTPDNHAPAAEENLAGLETNTWREDMYVADVIAATRPNVILDRSMPSALAWARIKEGRTFNAVNAEEVTRMRMWQRRMEWAGAVLVLLEASLELRVERLSTSGRPMGRDILEEEQRQLGQFIRMVRLPTVWIRAQSKDADSVVVPEVLSRLQPFVR